MTHEPKGLHRRIEFTVTDDLRARFWRRVQQQEHGCWLWLGAQRSAYGAIKHDGHVLGVHVVSYVIPSRSDPPGPYRLPHLRQSALRETRSSLRGHPNRQRAGHV